VVKRAYVQKNHSRIREIKAQTLITVGDEEGTDGKKTYPNESRRGAETDARVAINPEFIYLAKQIELDDETIVRNDLLINNVNRLIQLGTHLMRTK
jgi:hypothetical protein